MYSLILMTALSSAPDTVEFNGFFRRLFSFGGGGEGCSGSFLGIRDAFAARFNRSSGCYGHSQNCHGGRLRSESGRGSCHGSCYGSCTGRSAQRASCNGHSNSCNGGYASSCTGSVPAWSAPSYASPYSYSYGGASCFGSTPGFQSVPPGYDTLPASPTYPTIPAGPPIPMPSSPGFEGVQPATPSPADPPAMIPDSPASRRTFASSSVSPGTSTARATVVVRLPADARLYAEGQLLNLTSGEREFVTPMLPTNREFQYSFRVEYLRDGETISQSRKVAVRAGNTSAIEFHDLTQARAKTPLAPLPTLSEPKAPYLQTVQSRTEIAQKPTPQASRGRARIIVTLPPNTVLYVDGQKNGQTDLVREFSTPLLPAGREFAYTMKLESTRNGLPDVLTTKVAVRAGEVVPVDFTKLQK